jgi:hypothetical protein
MYGKSFGMGIIHSHYSDKVHDLQRVATVRVTNSTEYELEFLAQLI